MGNPDCPFSFRVSMVAINKAFKQQSFVDGVKQVGIQVNNLLSRSQEIAKPESAYFPTLIERRIDPLTGQEDLYWQGYKRSIDASMRRYIAYLKVIGASKDKIAQAKAEREQWQKIRDVVLTLNNGQAVQWLALMDADPQAGIALQQLSMDNGQLVLESQLLPFNQINQIEEFTKAIGADGQSLEIDIDQADGLSPLLTWAVKGEVIDFKQNLPDLICQARQELPLLRQPELIDFDKEEEQFEDRIVATGFWFSVIKWQELSRKTQSVEITRPMEIKKEIKKTEAVQEAPVEPLLAATVTFFEPVPGVIPVTEFKPSKETVTIFEAPIIKPMVINSEPEEKYKPLALTKQHLNVTVVKARCCFSEPEILEKAAMAVLPIRTRMTATTVFEPAAAAAVVVPTRMFLEGYKGQEEFTDKEEEEVPSQTVIQQKPETQKDVIYQAPPPINGQSVLVLNKYKKTALQKRLNEIPIYQHNWQPAAIEDIPEWVWQGTAADPDEIIDWPWFLVTMFYALLNTKVLLKARES